MVTPGIRFLALLSLTFLSCGCFERHTRIRLHADGSGELVIITTVQNAYLDYLKGVSGKSDPTKGFTEKRFKKAANAFGKDVEYVTHHLQKRTQDTRLLVQYRFRDITTLKIGLDPTLPLLGDTGATDSAPAYPTFSFHHRGSGQFTLYPPKETGQTKSVHVRVESDHAKQQRKERFEQERAQWMRFGNPFGLKGTENREALIRALGEGMRFRLEIEAMDPVHSTNARYRIGENRILLYSLEMKRLLDDPDLQPLLLDPTNGGPSWADLLKSDRALIEQGPYRLLELKPGP